MPASDWVEPLGAVIVGAGLNEAFGYLRERRARTRSALDARFDALATAVERIDNRLDAIDRDTAELAGAIRMAPPPRRGRGGG